MAKYSAVTTDEGAEVLTRLISSQKPLKFAGVRVGSGIPDTSPNTRRTLVQEEPVVSELTSVQFIDDVNTPYMKMTVTVTNQGILYPTPIREVLITVYDDTNKETPFCYSWISGPDTDNILPVSDFDEPDTIHLHEISLHLSNHEELTIEFTPTPLTFVNMAQLIEYAAPINHNQSSHTIFEETGESLEVSQRRQDFEIQALKEQLDTGFTGTAVTHTFTPSQIAHWKGYDGTGVPEGVLDILSNRLYL